MMDLQLQKALFDLFQSHLKFPFYDSLSDEGYPYAAFGYTQDNALDTKTSRGNRLFYQIDLFSAYNGQKEVKEMAQQVMSLFSDVISIGEGKVANLTEYNKLIQREDDIYHGILELTFEIY